MDSHAVKTPLPTIVTVPCFSGAPWDVESLTSLADWPLRTMRLPEGVNDVEAYADYVLDQVDDLEEYVLVGDSFGAVVALAIASRQPKGLRALVMSGGFAANPVTGRVGRAKLKAATFLPGPLYRHLTLRLHAAALASPFDAKGERPLSEAETVQLFRSNTPWKSYVARVEAVFSADYRSKLNNVNVPTLILTPEHDTLIGDKAATLMRQGIADSVEHVLAGTGHMFRFTHPALYAEHIERFLSTRLTATV